MEELKLNKFAIEDKDNVSYLIYCETDSENWFEVRYMDTKESNIMERIENTIDYVWDFTKTIPNNASHRYFVIKCLTKLHLKTKDFENAKRNML